VSNPYGPPASLFTNIDKGGRALVTVDHHFFSKGGPRDNVRLITVYRTWEKEDPAKAAEIEQFRASFDIEALRDMLAKEEAPRLFAAPPAARRGPHLGEGHGGPHARATRRLALQQAARRARLVALRGTPSVRRALRGSKGENSSTTRTDEVDDVAHRPPIPPARAPARAIR
jgi:hypothetical protein